MLPITFKEERRKLGKCRQRKVVHFNDLKPCFSPPEMHKKPSQLTSSGHREDTPQAENLRDGQQLPNLCFQISNDFNLIQNWVN